MNFLKENKVALLLALAKFILPYIFQHPFYELHRDEMLYLEQGHHLAWGFMEVPPMLGFLATVIHFFGSGFFWVKFCPSFFGAVNLFLLCRMTKEMGGKNFAQFVAGLGLICGGYLRVHFLFHPNFLDIFFWSLSAFYLIRYINTQQVKYVYAIAISLALGWLGKYSVAFFATAIFIGLLLNANRKLFLSKHLYAATVLALLIILPNLLWEYNHKWPVIHHMQELRETQLQFINPFRFLLNQLLMNIATSFVWIGGFIWLLFLKEGKPYRILAWMYLAIIVLLTATNGKDYYALGAYPMLFAAGGVWLQQITTVKMHWFRYAAVVIIFALFIPIIPAILPVWKPEKLAAYYRKTGLDKTGANHWEDLKDHELPQDFADMQAWKEMAGKVSDLYVKLPDSTKKRTMVYCRNYGMAGALKYYGKGLPAINSDNGSFLLWMPETYDVHTLLYVGRRIPEKDDEVFQQFEKYSVVDSITNVYAVEKGTKIILYENGNKQVSGMIEKGIREMKDEFRR